MKQNYLKKMNGYMPDYLKKSFARPIRNRLIKNRIFINCYEALEEFDKKSKDEQIAIQNTQLKKMLVYAYENVAYYNSQWAALGFDPYTMNGPEAIKNLPILTKETLLNHYEALLSKEKMKFYHAYSGGTTRMPTKYTLETASIYKEQAFKYHHFAKLGYDYKKSKLLTFRALQFKKDDIHKYNPLYNEIIVSPIKINENNLNKYLKLIQDFKPDYIQAYPSALHTFCKLLNIMDEKIENIQGVFFISESLTPEIRTYVERTLGCRSLDFYGHTERSVFGEEEDFHYNFHRLYGYTELLDGYEKGEKRIICTGFLNKKMPLIRYDTKDKAIISDGKVYLAGRFNSNEALYGRKGEAFCLEKFHFQGEVFNKVIYHQIVQEEKGVISFNVQGINLTKQDKEELEKIIVATMYEGVGIRFNYDQEIVFTSRGKYRRIIQKITA
jgi:phenylacetate-CoA ligase